MVASRTIDARPGDGSRGTSRRFGRSALVAVGATTLLVAVAVAPAALATSVPGVTAGSVTASVGCTDNPAIDTPALLAAITSSEKTNGTVSISAGTCALNQRLPVIAAVTIDGAGSDATFLVQHANTNIFQITGDGVTIENLNLDTATFNATPPVPKDPNPAVLHSSANRTTLMNVTAEAGSGFGMRFVGPQPCYTDQRSGDSLTNVKVISTGKGGFAAVDVSCQNGANLTNITIHGGPLAIYEDQNVTVSTEAFLPGPDSTPCAPPWEVTGPGHTIAIANVTAPGHGRVNGTVTGLSLSGQTQTDPACIGSIKGS